MRRKMVLFGAVLVSLLFSLFLLRATPTRAGRLPQKTTRVTTVNLKANQSNSNALCPITVNFTGVISTDGPATVRYTFLRSDGATGPEFSLDFKDAETKEVSTSWTLGDRSALPTYSGWQAIRILSPNELESSRETGAFTITCGVFQQVPSTARLSEKRTPLIAEPYQPQLAPLARPSIAPQPAPTTQAAAESPRLANEQEKKVNQTPPNPSPNPIAPLAPSGVFRVTLNGFTVIQETDDDPLEGDGRGDEIQVLSEVWVMNRAGNFLDRRSMHSRIIGDASGRPERQNAGSRQPGIFGGDVGGLRTGDSFPPNEPWHRTREPYADRIPMLLWQGTLTEGQDVAVILPSLWEWDSPDPAQPQTLWPGRLQSWMERTKPQLLEYLAMGPQQYLAGHPAISLKFPGVPSALDGNSPILAQDQHYGGLQGPVLTLSYDSAIQALQTSPSDKGPGIFEFPYSRWPLAGRYLVYVQVERIR